MKGNLTSGGRQEERERARVGPINDDAMHATPHTRRRRIEFNNKYSYYWMDQHDCWIEPVIMFIKALSVISLMIMICNPN